MFSHGNSRERKGHDVFPNQNCSWKISGMGEEKKCPQPQAKAYFEQYQNSSGLEVNQALQ
jgi:hypothetical protein